MLFDVFCIVLCLSLKVFEGAEKSALEQFLEVPLYCSFFSRSVGYLS